MNATGELVTLARVFASLLAVVALTLIAARLARRAGLRTPSRGVRVMERVPLTREATLAVVRVVDRAVVLGVTPHGVIVVTEIPPTETDQLYPTAGPEPDGVTVHRLPRGAGGALARLDPGEASGRGRPGRTEPGGTGAGQGTGSVLDPRTWRQGIEALRDFTTRRNG